MSLNLIAFVFIFVIAVQFYVIMVLNGTLSSLMVNGIYPRFMDIVEPKMATFCLWAEMGFDGIMIILISLLAGMRTYL